MPAFQLDPTVGDFVQDLVPWLLAGLLVVACAGLGLLWLALGRVREIERRAASLDSLDAVRRAVEKLTEDQGRLDLRRIEHGLIDLRDAHKRLEDRLVQVIETAAHMRPSGALGGEPGERAQQSPGVALAERILGRLIAQGYEHVQLVTPQEELAQIASSTPGDGEVRVEARRSGAPHKGRVIVRSGVITDVHLQSVYAIFP